MQVLKPPCANITYTKERLLRIVQQALIRQIIARSIFAKASISKWP